MDERDKDILIVEEEDLGPIEDILQPYLGSTIEEAVMNLSRELEIKPEEAVKRINKLTKKGRVKLVDPTPPKGFLSYFASQYSLWFWALLAFLGISISSIYFMPQIYPFVYVRYLCGALLLLYIPGFTLIEILYPKANDLDRIERFAFSIGLSIALVPTVGLVLNYMPWGIKMDLLLMSLILLILILGFIGVYRKYSDWIMIFR